MGWRAPSLPHPSFVVEELLGFDRLSCVLLVGEGDRYCWPLIRRTLIDKRTKRRFNALDSSIAVNDDIAVF